MWRFHRSASRSRPRWGWFSRRVRGRAITIRRASRRVSDARRAAGAAWPDRLWSRDCSCRFAALCSYRTGHPCAGRQRFVDIGAPQRVELRPEHIALELERLDRELLFGARPGMGFDVVERPFRIPLRLRRALREIGERLLADEIVVGQHAAHALADDIGREELGERRGDRLERAARAAEFDIGIDGETRRRQNAFGRDDVVAGKTETIGELQPALDAAVARLEAVVIFDPLAPLAPVFRIGEARENRRVLDRDHRLIIIAIERPGLNFLVSALAAILAAMKAMPIVIALGSHVA